MLDLELNSLLRLTKSNNYVKIYEQGAAQVRKNVKMLAGLTALPSEPVYKVKEYEINNLDSTPLTVRVYYPLSEKHLQPALIYFHGGGFVLYDINDYDTFCRFLAVHAGVIVVAVDYRRAPEFKCPTAYEDAITATRWVWQHANALGIDPDKIGIGGDSAGGNLAGYVCKHQHELNINFFFNLLIYPLLSFNRSFNSYIKYGENYFLDVVTLDWFREQFMNIRGEGVSDTCFLEISAVDPFSYTPLIIAVAKYDVLRDESIQYYKHMSRKGVNTTLLYFDQLAHNFLLLAGKVKAAKDAIGQIAHTIYCFTHKS